MPIFEYLCRKCEHEFELLVRGEEAIHCPSCNSQRLEKQLSVFAPSVPNNNQRRELPMSGCGTCGDPRGPGSCSLN
jgi:putative FmdB family regulatory protein